MTTKAIKKNKVMAKVAEIIAPAVPAAPAAIVQSIVLGKPKWGPKNALVWIHPDRQGGKKPAIVQYDRLEPQMRHKPYRLQYRSWTSCWLYFEEKPVWLWQEVKIGDEYNCVPYEPEPDKTLTAREVYDRCSNFGPAIRYNHPKNKVFEYIKLGILATFAGILLLALFLLANS